MVRLNDFLHPGLREFIECLPDDDSYNEARAVLTDIAENKYEDGSTSFENVKLLIAFFMQFVITDIELLSPTAMDYLRALASNMLPTLPSETMLLGILRASV